MTEQLGHEKHNDDSSTTSIENCVLVVRCATCRERMLSMKYKKVDLPPHERLKSLEDDDEQQVTLKQGGTTLKRHIAPKAVL